MVDTINCNLSFRLFAFLWPGSKGLLIVSSSRFVRQREESEMTDKFRKFEFVRKYRWIAASFVDCYLPTRTNADAHARYKPQRTWREGTDKKKDLLINQSTLSPSCIALYSSSNMPYISVDGTVGGKPSVMAQVFGFFASKSFFFTNESWSIFRFEREREREICSVYDRGCYH